MNALVSYFKNVRAELTHVVWPPYMQGVWHTVLIILISTVIALAITGLDYVFTGVVARIVG